MLVAKANLASAEEEKESSKNRCQHSSEDEEEDDEGILLLTVHPQGQGSRLKAQCQDTNGNQSTRYQGPEGTRAKCPQGNGFGNYLILSFLCHSTLKKFLQLTESG